MTREEEIKARLEKAQVNASSYPVTRMDADLAYLLARNEELQRRVETLQRYCDAVKWLEEVQVCYFVLQPWLQKASREFVQNFFNENFKIEQEAKKEAEAARNSLDAAETVDVDDTQEGHE